MSLDFETRLSDLTLAYIPCEPGEYNCPPSLISWFTPPCPGYIVGQLRDSRTGGELGNFDLWVASFDTESFGEFTTDSLGRYNIGPLEAADTYSLTASGNQYSYLLWENLAVPEYGLLQNLETYRTGHVRCLVYDTTESPIAGAEVRLTQVDEPSWGGGMAITDEFGKCCVCSLDTVSMDGSPVATYSIRVVHEGYSDFNDTLSVTPRYEDGDEIVLEVTLENRATIHGTVTLASVPLPEAAVFIYQTSTGTRLDESGVSTDINGEFELVVSAPCTYGLTAQGDGTNLADIEVSVIPNQVIPLTLNLLASGKIEGTITDLEGQPIAGATVVLLTPDGTGPVLGTETGVDGTYELLEVNPYSNWQLSVIVPTAQYNTQFPIVSDIAVTPSLTTVRDLQADTVNPYCQINSPSPGSTVSGDISIVVDLSDNQGIGHTTLLLNGDEIQSLPLTEYLSTSVIQQSTVAFDWSSQTVANGTHTIGVRVVDLAGNAAEAEINLSIDN